jgi:hypothetical protein
MIQALITSLLQIHAATWVSANLLDGEGDGVRVYHQRIPQGSAYPAVVYNLITQTPENCKGGIAMHRYEVSFTVYHADDVEAETIADHLIELLDGWQGTEGGKLWHYTSFTRKVEGFNDPQKLASKIVDFLFIREN